MAIPDYQSIMLPLLEFAQDGKERSAQEAISHVIQHFSLSPEEQRELLASGKQPVIDNRTAWAVTYLKKAGLLESTRRAHFKITPRGVQVLQEKPQRITAKFLKQFPEFNEFINLSKDDHVVASKTTETAEFLQSQSPQDLIDTGYKQLEETEKQELLLTVKKASPRFFERMVVELVVAMGYGESVADVSKLVTAATGDEGIDGAIPEDRLGLGVIYIQAKRWGEKTKGRPDVQSFVGALHGQHAAKGIFITTSTFSQEAKDYVKKIQDKIVLIDGKRLVDLMFEYNIGVAIKSTYRIKKVDTDYFLDE